MKRGRPTVLTPELQNKIARYLFLAFTDEQIATLCGIGLRTFHRFRANGVFWQSIKRLELEREAGYRERVWNAKGFWQGSAWFLERKYPTQFAKPEIQLAVNNQINQGPTNILVVGPERAALLATRHEQIRAKTRELLERNGDSEGH